MPGRTYSAPIPFGAYSLWPATVSRSTPSSSTSVGTLPTDWAASVWKGIPCSCATRAISAIGCSVPTSLLACMMLIERRAGLDGAAYVVRVDEAEAIDGHDRHPVSEPALEVAAGGEHGRVLDRPR